MLIFKNFRTYWDTLPKPLKVFIYLVISIILSESLIELANIEQGFFVRILAQIMNLAVVLIQGAVREVEKKLSE